MRKQSGPNNGTNWFAGAHCKSLSAVSHKHKNVRSRSSLLQEGALTYAVHHLSVCVHFLLC